MGGSTPTPPPVPQAQQIAPIAAQTNLQTAQQQAALNNVSQQGPMGGYTYNKNPDGTYSLTQSFNPEVQKTIQGGLSQFNAQGAAPGVPNLDPSNAVNEALSMQQRYMDPYFKQQTQGLDSSLKNEGFVPGTEAYDNEMRKLRDQQASVIQGDIAQFEPIAYNQNLQNYQTQLQRYMMPLQTAESAYGSLSPNLFQTPQTGVPATDVAGMFAAQGKLAQDAYNTQMAQYMNNQNNLWSIPKALAGNVGKMAGGGFGGSSG
jgi:hypothetical protein